MGGLILLMVVLMGIIAVPLSLAIYYVALSTIKGKGARRAVETRCTSTSIFMWVLIFFFPVSYGQSGSNYEMWFAIWATKTALIIFVPSVLVILFSFSFYLGKKKSRSKEQRTYDSLAKAVEVQKAGKQKGAVASSISVAAKKSYGPLKPRTNLPVSMYLLAPGIVSIFYISITAASKSGDFIGTAMLALFSSTISFIAWLFCFAKMDSAHGGTSEPVTDSRVAARWLTVNGSGGDIGPLGS